MEVDGDLHIMNEVVKANFRRYQKKEDCKMKKIFDHQIKIAKRTLRMPAEMLGVMGGMTKDQAMQIIEDQGKKAKDRFFFPLDRDQIVVSHNPNFASRHFEPKDEDLIKDFYQEAKVVAIVDTNDLDEAFRLTNHIDHPWQNNLEIVKCFWPKPRSTSVGDFMQIGDDVYVVEMIGFRKLIEGGRR